MIDVKEQKLGENIRKSFSKTYSTFDLPNLVEVQTKSYNWFLETGFRDILRDVSPIEDFSGNLILEFLDYSLDSAHPKYPVEECKERNVNYAAPMKLNVRLRDKRTDEIKTSDIFIGEFPLMTKNGTFVINGAERVIVSQIIRSPGMYYASDIDKAGLKSFSATVIPYRGAWLEYETDTKGIVYVKIDKNRKVPITTFIRALGVETRDAMMEMFGYDDQLAVTHEKDECERLAAEAGTTPREEALKEIYKKIRPGEPAQVESAELLLNNLFFDNKRYDISPVGRYKFDKKMALQSRITGHTLAKIVSDPYTGEIIAEPGEVVTEELANTIAHSCVNSVFLIDEELTDDRIHAKKASDPETFIKVISNNTVEPEYVLGFDLKDCGVKEKANIRVLREILEEGKGDKEAVKALARERINELCPRHITKDDIFASIGYILNLKHGIGNVDDIDHLGNRRIRSVGEQLQNQMRIGFARMDKMIREKMTTLNSSQESDKITPQMIINIHPIVTAIREFFGSSQLSQFMDQANPLSELTHKRRLSALGPGGLSRDRASFDVRDVHYTYYGRICPIETPEGPNIGLISYLTTYAHINDYGFIEAPYRRVVHSKKADGTVVSRATDELVYMTADMEDLHVIAQANEPLDENGVFLSNRVTAREKSEFIEVDPSEVDFIDISPKMVVSVATATIPFLENDDNSRALMGSNMQKQAVPLLVTESPIVGTGMEYKAAHDSGVIVMAEENGTVVDVDACGITVKSDEDGSKHKYAVMKFKRTNQGTCFNQRPIVSKGEKVTKGQVIADGPATSNGELALGKNALIGFMTWEGYNYEDAVLLNERLVREDMYTSIHIEEYSTEARSTKIGDEEITKEIPNVGEDGLKDLTADGIVRIGTEVRAGDILVGKITPKGETERTAEERLLQSIFGEKAKDVRDTSLRLPHGESGIVVDVKVFSRDDKDELPVGVNRVVRVYVAQKRKISVGDKMAGRHGNKGVVSRILPPEDMPFLADGTPLDIVLNPLGIPSRMNIGQVLEVHLGLAAKKLGWKVMTPVFDGATEQDILECMKAADMSRFVRSDESLDELKGKETFTVKDPATGEKRLKVIDGKTILYDGRTGEPFDNPVTVGIMYYLKLHHLVDDKIHARSNGPYSLVTQQPLGGKAQFGGQRFGEMEVWALEAYGAAYTLQEILTVKSDDIVGRRKTYEAIIKGQNIPKPGVPESFKVLVRELQALALDVRVLNEDGEEVELSELNAEEETSPYTRNENLRTSERGYYGHRNKEETEDVSDDVSDEESYDESDDMSEDVINDMEGDEIPEGYGIVGEDDNADGDTASEETEPDGGDED